jgi:hypothetical protein
VFGPGVGECIVVHLGDGDWIVVDSCVDKQSGRPVALEYLESLGADVGKQVRLVVATHWHDDHIQGLAQTLRAAARAKFVSSAAYALQDLVRLTELSGATAPLSSATKEYSEVFEILKERREYGARRDTVGPIQALANRRLLSLKAPERSISAEVFALSPGDGTFNLAQAEIGSVLSQMKARLRPTRPSQNQLCVVLWLQIGLFSALLGADLEFVTGSNEGWTAIVNSNERPEGTAAFVKVPHHGSENAHCPACWERLLVEQPFAVLTPYGPSKLPRRTDLARLCAMTRYVFLTTNPKLYRVPRRENAVEKTLRETAVTRRAVTGAMGHVRFRCDARSSLQEPTIQLQNGAQGQCKSGSNV